VTCIFAMSIDKKIELGKKLSNTEIASLYTTKFGSKFLDSPARLEIFKYNLKKVLKHNRNPKKLYTEGINQFSALTDEEFSEQYNLHANQNCSATFNEKIPFQFALQDAPAEWDWRDFGVVSDVKDQGKCGSCWTFSTTGAVEAHQAILSGQAPLILSEQQLIDCAQDFDNHGCSGGLPSHAFEYIKYAGGLQYEADYAYEAKDGECRTKGEAPRVKVEYGSYNITLGDEEELKNAIWQFGPVSVAFQVASDFRNYKTGVYDSKICKNSTQDVNHAVLAVGYGTTEDGVDYWIVKNSWNSQWGDKGYFKIKRGVNMCGIAVCNSFPNLKKD